MGLMQRLLEDQAQRQAHLNRQIRVVRLSAARGSARGRPQGKRVLADPDSQIAASPQAFVVFSPVGHPMPLNWDLVTTISVELVRHSQIPECYKPQRYQRCGDLCNKAELSSS
ncbi:MAG: hypothetical protein ABJO75_12680 [Sedimentitalea sp.]|uniref:hypothetical protein n=1 Tax=Sedimentitalea sp. TaxID=2048915 RepID=UPI0032674A46